MAKFRKKPVVIEAEQFLIRSDPETWPVGITWGGDRPDGTGTYVVVTAHGQKTIVVDGDWIIPEPDGRGHYPCKPDIFAATYEEVE